MQALRTNNRVQIQKLVIEMDREKKRILNNLWDKRGMKNPVRVGELENKLALKHSSFQYAGGD